MKKRTIREAIIKTLKDTNQPLSSIDVYNYIIENDLYRFNAQYPEAIVRIEIRRHCIGVDFPTAKSLKLFQILPNGTYWLKDEPIPGQLNLEEKPIKQKKDLIVTVADLRDIHERHKEAFKQELLNQLRVIDPKLFESFAKRLLEVYGFKEMHVTKYVRDGGIDGYGKLKVGITYLHVAFQCKRWSSNISRTEIDKFRGAIQGEYEQGILFTTAGFSKEALTATRKSGAVPIILIDGNTLVDIMIEKQFGVETESYPVYVNALDTTLTEEA